MVNDGLYRDGDKQSGSIAMENFMGNLIPVACEIYAVFVCCQHVMNMLAPYFGFNSFLCNDFILQLFLFPDARSDFPTAYNPKYVESNWYSWWEKHGYFIPNSADTGKSFSMVLPPPNVTGTLHLGHALTCTIQDVLARW